MIETTRRKVLASLNSRYIYGKIVSDSLSGPSPTGASLGRSSAIMETDKLAASPTCHHIPSADSHGVTIDT